MSQQAQWNAEEQRRPQRGAYQHQVRDELITEVIADVGVFAHDRQIVEMAAGEQHRHAASRDQHVTQTQ